MEITNANPENWYKSMLRSTLGATSAIQGLEYLLDEEGNDSDGVEELDLSDLPSEPFLRQSPGPNKHVVVMPATDEPESGDGDVVPPPELATATSEDSPPSPSTHHNTPMLQEWKSRMQQTAQQSQHLHLQVQALAHRQKTKTVRFRDNALSPLSNNNSGDNSTTNHHTVTTNSTIFSTPNSKTSPTPTKPSKMKKFQTTPKPKRMVHLEEDPEDEEDLGLVGIDATADADADANNVDIVPATPHSPRNLPSKIPTLTPSSRAPELVTDTMSPDSMRQLQQLGLRNKQLQHSWNEQQEQTRQLQQQLERLQQQHDSERLQWVKEKENLLTPRKVQSLEEQLANERDRRIDLQTHNVQLQQQLKLQKEQMQHVDQFQEQLQQERLEHEQEMEYLEKHHEAQVEALKWEHEQKEQNFRRVLQETTLELEEALQQNVQMKQQLEGASPSKLNNDAEKETAVVDWKAKYQQLEQDAELRIQDLQSQVDELLEATATTAKATSNNNTTTNSASYPVNTSLPEGYFSTDLQDYVDTLEQTHASELLELQRQLNATQLSADSLDMTTNLGDYLPDHLQSTPSKHIGVSKDNDHSQVVSPILSHRTSVITLLDESSNEPDETEIAESSNAQLDMLINEVKDMEEERAALLEEVHGDKSGEDPAETSVNDELALEVVGQGSDDTNTDYYPAHEDLMNVTMDVLNQLTELENSRVSSVDQETSVLEKLEVLSDIMGRSHDISHSLMLPAQEESQAIEIAESNEPAVGWYELATELRRQVAYLEHDRDEVVRITGSMMDQARESHRVELEAAKATARRVGYEEGQETSRVHLQYIMARLCPMCQSSILQG